MTPKRQPTPEEKRTMAKAIIYSNHVIFVWMVFLVCPLIGIPITAGHYAMLISPSIAQLLFYKDIPIASRLVSTLFSGAAIFILATFFGVTP